MKRLTICMAALMVMGMATAQTGNEWDNPQVTHVNRETAHTVGIPMGSEADAAADMSASPWYLSLDGKWKFLWVKQPSLAKSEYCAAEVGIEATDDITAIDDASPGDSHSTSTHVYDLSGRRLAGLPASAHGIYISGNKKILK